MIEIGKSAREYALKFPVGHPERTALEGLAQIAENWGKANGTQKPESLQVEQLVVSESAAWKSFFGKEVKTPNPPDELFEVWDQAQEQGINSFEAHFLPKVELKQNAKHPGWKVKPEVWFWDKIKEGKIDKSASQLSGNWVLIDATPKPDYDNGKQVYPNDPFSVFIEDLKNKGKVQRYSSVPDNSRFGISWDEVNTIVNPEITQTLAVDQNKIRLPKAIEFNLIGNIFHPEWGQTSTWEWFADKFGDDDRLLGGRSVDGGLADVGCAWQFVRYDCVGFRPLVEFSSKS